MTCTTCPNCGFDLERVETLHLGHLTIIRSSAVYWRGERVMLTPQQLLIVCAIARADGAQVSNVALWEAIGTEGDRSARVFDTQLCKLRRAFKAIDPSFNMIERGSGRYSSGGARWRVED